MTYEDIEQWVKDHPIQWEETTADDQYGNTYNIIVESNGVGGSDLFYLIDEFPSSDGNIKYEVVKTDNHRRHKRCDKLYVGTGNSVDEAKRVAEENRIMDACVALRIKFS